MKGKLGSLHDKESQVGGIIGWEVTPQLKEFIQVGDLVHKADTWKITAQGYWLFDIPDQVIVKLYSEGKGYWEGVGYITSQTKNYMDTLIRESIEITGGGILAGKE